MDRMQLYITPEIKKALKTTARQNGKKVAQIAREVLSKGLKVKQSQKTTAAFLDSITGIGKKGSKDLSTNLFDYLYGDKSPNYGKNKKTSR